MPLVDVRAYSPAPVRGAATASRSSRAQQSPLPMNVQLLSDDLENGRSAAADADDSDAHVAKYAHKRPTHCCVRFGNTYVLCSCASSYGMFPTTCHVGPNWPCMLFTYFISLGPTLLLLFAYVFIQRPSRWPFVGSHAVYLLCEQAERHEPGTSDYTDHLHGDHDRELLVRGLQ